MNATPVNGLTLCLCSSPGAQQTLKPRTEWSLRRQETWLPCRTPERFDFQRSGL